MKPFVDPSEEVVYVDCYGRPCRDELVVQHGDQTYRFIWDPKLKSGRRFHLGIFQDRSAVHRCVFRYPKHRRVAVLTESPIEPYFDRFSAYESRFPLILTHDARLLARGAPYEKFYYGTSFISRVKAPTGKSKMCSFMGSIQHGNEAGYALRRTIANDLIANERVDCFGRGICPVETKEMALAPYRFSIAMENTQRAYYFTEKIIDCFLVDTVPIYWGSPSIKEVFDSRGIIFFNTLGELHQILDSLTAEKHEQMLPFVRRNKAIAHELKIASYEQMHERFAEAISSQNIPNKSVSRLCCSRGAAAIRMMSVGKSL